jgi:pyridoxal phosphate enzyme (YggS family)
MADLLDVQSSLQLAFPLPFAHNGLYHISEARNSPLSPEHRERINTNLHAVQTQIARAAEDAGRDPAEVTLVAVTKTVLPAAIRVVYDLGVRHFGENRVQEARDKLAMLDLPDAQWEMIGTLQRNKARLATRLFARVQSIDNLALAQALDRAAGEQHRVMPVLIEVNVAGEATKHGVAPEDALPLARALATLPHLRGTGLMTVAPIAEDPAAVRPIFRRLRLLRDAIRAELGANWYELSMGMTDDFPVAIAEGATLVRLGRAIFGARS